jgi:hypothetical protein
MARSSSPARWTSDCRVVPLPINDQQERGRPRRSRRFEALALRRRRRGSGIGVDSGCLGRVESVGGEHRPRQRGLSCPQFILQGALTQSGGRDGVPALSKYGERVRPAPSRSEVPKTSPTSARPPRRGPPSPFPRPLDTSKSQPAVADTTGRRLLVFVAMCDAGDQGLDRVRDDWPRRRLKDSLPLTIGPWGAYKVQCQSREG